MKKKWIIATATTALLFGTVSGSAFAFNDLDGVQDAAKIVELRDRGVVSGVGEDQFAPYEKMSAQFAIPLIVKGLELNLDTFKFAKAPAASDYFTNIPDGAWYAEAFVTAHLNGLPIDQHIDPTAEVSREQFVQWLMSAVYTTGDYAFVRMFVMLEDESDVSEGYMNFIQEAVLGKIVSLDDDRRFRPQDPITRAEAAIMVRNAISFVETHTPIPEQPANDPIETGEVTVETEAVADTVQKVVLSMGEKPHPGWDIRITGIDFPEPGTAIVRYSVSYPDPAALYPMVITYPKAETYLDASIEDIRYTLDEAPLLEP